MSEHDPLSALWAADEPPARDPAFVAAALARAAQGAGRRDGLQRTLGRLLGGLGVGTGTAGAALVLAQAAGETWSLAVVAGALASALMAGRALLR